MSLRPVLIVTCSVLLLVLVAGLFRFGLLLPDLGSFGKLALLCGLGLAVGFVSLGGLKPSDVIALPAALAGLLASLLPALCLFVLGVLTPDDRRRRPVVRARAMKSPHCFLLRGAIVGAVVAVAGVFLAAALYGAFGGTSTLWGGTVAYGWPGAVNGLWGVLRFAAESWAFLPAVAAGGAAAGLFVQ